MLENKEQLGLKDPRYISENINISIPINYITIKSRHKSRIISPAKKLRTSQAIHLQLRPHVWSEHR